MARRNVIITELISSLIVKIGYVLAICLRIVKLNNRTRGVVDFEFWQSSLPSCNLFIVLELGKLVCSDYGRIVLSSEIRIQTGHSKVTPYFQFITIPRDIHRSSANNTESTASCTCNYPEQFSTIYLCIILNNECANGCRIGQYDAVNRHIRQIPQFKITVS